MGVEDGSTLGGVTGLAVVSGVEDAADPEGESVLTGGGATADGAHAANVRTIIATNTVGRMVIERIFPAHPRAVV